eukprot:scaffold101350_cov21-Prasinocladus_malaysianus.AAC.1
MSRCESARQAAACQQLRVNPNHHTHISTTPASQTRAPNSLGRNNLIDDGYTYLCSLAVGLVIAVDDLVLPGLQLVSPKAA